MKLRLFFLSILLLSFLQAEAQGRSEKLYCVGFYNLENLFDTIHDEGKNDFEFLPKGTNRWGTVKYKNKIRNMAKVLGDMGTDILPEGMAVVGVSEIENARVLKDLVEHESLASRGWDYVHIEGPDKRGVDCALLYNPRLFMPVESRLVPYITEGDDRTYKTRGFLVVSGKLGGETVHFIVNHWPSRYSESATRERAGVQVRQLKDSLMAHTPESKVIVMGDMNDNPDDRSLSVSLGAVYEKENVKLSSSLYNPWRDILRKNGKGTLKYRGKWELFDQIMVSGNMLGCDRRTLKLYKAEIFSRDYLFQQEGRYKGSIKRTHAGGVWLDGYSDHLPVIVYLVKELE